MHCNLQSPDVTPSVVHTKFEVGHSIHSWLITILLLIPYVTLWPWPLTFWPWMFAVYRPWRDQPLEQIVAKSNNLRLSYSDLFIEHLGATPPILDFTIVNINYCAIALDSQRTQTPNFSEIKQLIVELSVMAILILSNLGAVRVLDLIESEFSQCWGLRERTCETSISNFTTIRQYAAVLLRTYQVSSISFFMVFTALHGMQSRYSDGNSVCLSVHLSVCLSVKRVHCDKTEESCV